MAFAQMPLRWAHPKPDRHDPKVQRFTLADLHWSDHRAGGIAALLILLTLCIRLNEVGRLAAAARKPRPDTVTVTWDEFRRITGHAKATVGKAIMLLESWGAIRITKIGRTNHYQLVDVHKPAEYCMIPVSYLEKNGDPISRFKDLPGTSLGLNALKLYIVLLILRSTEYGTTSISFNGITRWTGIRREDIRKAWAFLDSQQLATVSTVRDSRHNRFGADDQSQRYAIVGLTRGHRKEDAEIAEAGEAYVESMYRPGLPNASEGI
jgi:hypothetical protein